MSKKPIKKSDEGKNWITKRKDRAIRSKLEYHLIICEGTKTEPNYFMAMREDINMDNKNKITIEVIGKGRSTTNLLDIAIKKIRTSANYISNVWLVYDKDEFTNESFNETSKMCDKINEQGETEYNAIWSNESIELWFLLHFIKFDTKIGRKVYIEKLNENLKKKKLDKYQKNDKQLYNKLKPYLEDAIQNAKWLEANYSRDALPSEMNPCTKVYKLVEVLKKYID